MAESIIGKSGIYQITNLLNGKRYIGSAAKLNCRRNEHWSQLQKHKHHSSALQNAWNKYGPDAFQFKVLMFCDPADMLLYEQAALDAFQPEYNILKIAGTSLGRKASPETRAKIAAKAQGRKVSAETIAKRSATVRGRKNASMSARLMGNKINLGRKLSEERKRQISAFMTGRPCPKSPEHRAKIAATLRGRKASLQHRLNQSAAQYGKKRGPYKSSKQKPPLLPF